MNIDIPDDAARFLCDQVAMSGLVPWRGLGRFSPTSPR